MNPLAAGASGAPDTEAADRDAWVEAYQRVRAASGAFCEHFSVEDHALQAMTEASPLKWHLAHTTWFFDTLILQAAGLPSPAPDAAYAVLFNSYYNALGEPFPRPRRGLLSRPSLAEVHDYRQRVDRAITEWICTAGSVEFGARRAALELGLHHEQQHQELMVTDVLCALAENPLALAIFEHRPARVGAAPPLDWHAMPGGECEIGAPAEGFAFDNERPRHRVILNDWSMANRPATNGEFIAFIAAGGYRDPLLWTADGWAWLQRTGIEAPLYWRRVSPGDDAAAWRRYGLDGLQPVVAAAPVVHISWYEAQAFANWAQTVWPGARLPREAEWERAAQSQAPAGHFADRALYQPQPAAGAGLVQLFGDVWEWTLSAYQPYPGFRPFQGAAAEYNGKFMVNQMVLRGGSCATSPGHIRPSYRNFFYPADRWQFSGLRLARDG